MSTASLPIALIAVFVAAKVFGEIAKRLGQSAVLGELVGGVVVGISGLGLVDAHDPVIHLLAQLGVIFLLFLIGLETDLERLISAGGPATAVACVGVALPFVAGYCVGALLGYRAIVSVFLGASLTATSVGITARVLSDLGHLRDAESQVILGAAVVDDIIGLVLLTIVGSLAGGEISTGTLIAGSAMIIGSFAAGLALARTGRGEQIERGVHQVARLVIPIFFVSVGAAIDLRSMTGRVIGIGLALTLAGIIGKVAAGYVARMKGLRRLIIGVGMIPRGEVGLIFAQIGLSSRLLDNGLYNAVALMVVLTTFIAPMLLRRMLAPLDHERRET